MRAPSRGLRSIPYAALGIVLLVSLAVAVAATRHVPNAASSPLEPGGRWHAALIWSLVASFAAYAAASVASLRRPCSRRLAAAVAVVAQLIPLAAPLLLSTDAFTYWDYGRLGASHGANPYAVVPNAYPHDPAYAVMGGSWREQATIYGPLFTYVSELVSRVVSSPHEAELAFRLLAAGSMVALVLVLWRAGAPAAAVILAGWSPLLALHFAGGGHNDALMMVFVVAALATGKRAPWLSACFWVAGAAVKWVAVAFLALVLLALPPRDRFVAMKRLAVAAAFAFVLSVVEYGTEWLAALRGLSEQSRRTGSLGAAKWLEEAGLGHRPIVALLGLATLCFLGTLAWLAYRRRMRHLSLAGTGLAFLQGWLNPWYASWGASLLESEEAALPAVVASLVLSAIALRDALPL